MNFRFDILEYVAFCFIGYYQTETFANHKHETSQVAANETVDTGADAQTIMIIQDREAYADSKDGFLVQSNQVNLIVHKVSCLSHLKQFVYLSIYDDALFLAQLWPSCEIFKL